MNHRYPPPPAACLCLILLTACSPPERQDAETAELEAVQEVEALLQAQTEDWSRGDITAFTSIYADNCLFLSPTGRVEGREALTARYRERYPGPEGMGTLRFEIIEMRPAFVTSRQLLGVFQSSDIGGMSVAARWHLSWPDREPAAGFTLIVLRRTPAGWRIVQDASMQDSGS